MCCLVSVLRGARVGGGGVMTRGGREESDDAGEGGRVVSGSTGSDGYMVVEVWILGVSEARLRDIHARYSGVRDRGRRGVAACVC